MSVRAGVFALCLLFAWNARADQILDVVVDRYVAEAREFWNGLKPESTTMRGKVKELRVTRLALLNRTIAPRAHADVRKRVGRALYAAYLRAERGTPLESRSDLLMVADRGDDPEAFYERHPRAQGLLRVSAPAVSGDEALVYAQLMMVYREEGRVLHLRKENGRWRVVWSLVVYDTPGC
jgi:hypothetical protein